MLKIYETLGREVCHLRSTIHWPGMTDGNAFSTSGAFKMLISVGFSKAACKPHLVTPTLWSDLHAMEMEVCGCIVDRIGRALAYSEVAR